MSESEDPNVVDAELVEPEALPAAPSTSPGVPVPEADYSEGGVPSFDYVRDRIENRYSTSAGETELAGVGTDNTVAEWDRKLADRDKAGQDKLEEIRRAMRGE